MTRYLFSFKLQKTKSKNPAHCISHSDLLMMSAQNVDAPGVYQRRSRPFKTKS